MVLSDEELIARYQSTENAPEHADELLRRYSARAVSWCWRFSHDREMAMDLAQEVLLKAYRHLASFRADSKFSTWLYLIAKNHCLNHLRDRASKAVDMAKSLDADVQDTHGLDVLTRLEREEDLEELRKVMARTLDEIEAQVMMLHYGEDIPLKDITSLLQLENRSGAKAYIVSAKRKLDIALRRWRASDRPKTE